MCYQVCYEMFGYFLAFGWALLRRCLGYLFVIVCGIFCVCDLFAWVFFCFFFVFLWVACCINFAVVCVISSWRLCCLYVAVWVIYFIFVCVNSLLMLVFFRGFLNHFLCDLRGCLVGLFACFFVTSSSLLCLYFSFCVVLLPWLCGFFLFSLVYRCAFVWVISFLVFVCLDFFGFAWLHFRCCITMFHSGCCLRWETNACTCL